MTVGPRGGTQRGLNTLNLPTAAEIEAYYLSSDALSPERMKIVRKFVRKNYVDGGTREKFLNQRKRVEKAIAALMEKMT